MPTRTLDWNGLVRVAQRRDPTDRIIALAGVPARVVPHLSTDAGFYVRTLDEEARSNYWSLRTREDIVLLRALVDAGVVTIDDNEDAWRSAEWDALLRDTTRGCFVAGCSAGCDDIDIRGPVCDDRHRMHKACTPHWEGLMGVLGAQPPAGADEDERDSHQVEVVNGAGELVRQMCSVCGAGPDTPHDGAAHDAYVANLPLNRS